MSRIAKATIVVPVGVNVKINNQVITISSEYDELTRIINDAVEINYINNTLIFNPRDGYTDGWAHAGTARALLNSMIIGVTKGFTKKLQLVGVGYRVAIKSIKENTIISLSLGFSHLIEYRLPAGIIVECPTQTEIVLKSADKQLIGQVVADLRAYRYPEPYKGKGICYVDEIIRTKEAKKK